jgi:hypothetical protein
MPTTGFSYLADLLQEIRQEKTAAVKSAKPLSEPGGYAGPSTHPSADAPDDLIKEQTGFRFAENTADAKKSREQPGVDVTADAVKPATEGTPEQDKRQLDIGVESSSTGAAPALEDDYKGNKDDPGTSSVMKADDGEKYAAYRALPFAKLAERATARSNELLADIANLRVPAAAPPAAPEKTAAAPGAAPAPAAAAPTRAQAEELVGMTIKEASLSADLVVDYLTAFHQKQAGGADAGHGEDHAPPPGGPPPGMDPSGGAPPGMGGGPPPGGPPPGAGGPPPGLDAAGAGQPGMPMQASPDEAKHELAAALMDMGMTPDDLMEIAQHMAASGGGAPGGAPGGPPGGPPPGGPPPDGGDPAKMAQAENLYKAAQAVKQYKRAGSFRHGAPKTARAAALRERMVNYIQEACRAVG